MADKQHIAFHENTENNAAKGARVMHFFAATASRHKRKRHSLWQNPEPQKHIQFFR